MKKLIVIALLAALAATAGCKKAENKDVGATQAQTSSVKTK
jgi:tetrahydromethanopterin S-methyltransferase subunit E